MNVRRRVASIILLLFATPAFVNAQRFEPPRFTIGAAGGVTNPLHGDLQFLAPSWDVSVRGQVAPRVAIEGFMSQWRHSTETVRSGVPLGGVPGQIGEVAIEDRDRVSMVGFTFQPTFSIGRATVAGGGGPAVMVFRSDYAQRLSGCDAGAAAPCGTYETHYSNGTFAVVLGGSVDVRLASRLTTFVQVRAGIPTEDPGSGHVAATVGVRLVLR